MVRKLFSLLIALLLPVLAMAENRQVIDEMQLLDPDEVQEINAQMAAVEDKYLVDLAVLITDQVPDDTTEDLAIVRNYADTYYDNGGFGMRLNGSGVLFLLDMNNCVIYISTGGDMIMYLDERRETEIMDAMFEFAAAGDYEGTVRCFVSMIEEYLWQGIDIGAYFDGVDNTNNVEYNGGDR